MNSETSPGLSAKLFLRADSEPGIERSRQRIADRLSALERVGTLDEYDVFVWGRELRLSGALKGTDYYRTILNHLEAFDEWATTTDESLDLPFQRHEIESVITGESYQRVVLPAACLAVYHEGELEGVYPNRSTDGTCSVGEYLSELEANGTPSSREESIPS